MAQPKEFDLRKVLSLSRIRLALLALVTLPHAAIGAEVTHVMGKNVITIEGEIEIGDCLKLVNVIQNESANVLFLASPGGSVREAMKIGRLARTLKLATYIPGYMDIMYEKRIASMYNVSDFDRNFMCASSCFFIFVGGVERSNEGTRPFLGIHRPFISESELSKLSGEQALLYAKQIRETVVAYLREMGVPYKYSEKMFSIPPNKIEWIEAEAFNEDFDGLIPDLQEWVKSKIRSDLEKVRQDLEEIRRIPDMDVSKKIKNQGEVEYGDAIRQLSDPTSNESYVMNELRDETWSNTFGSRASGKSGLCDDPR